MKFILLVLALVAVISVPAQKHFRLDHASKSVDVDLDVGKCDADRSICGPVTVSFLRKGDAKPFQLIRLAQTQMWDPEPQANVTNRYDDQSVVNFGDFNFDGTEDVAICDGNNGGYGMPSYRVYIYSKPLKRFVYSRSFTRMNSGGLGMFEVDQKKKMLMVYTKSGCCWHQTGGLMSTAETPEGCMNLPRTPQASRNPIASCLRPESS